ncbi:hypothetical protein HanRHA438_Chr02g0053191 [Helianthus annuus]|nr:hypothetical protein HanRHA438_Chr02g0053191 [Helianthus annuus]
MMMTLMMKTWWWCGVAAATASGGSGPADSGDSGGGYYGVQTRFRGFRSSWFDLVPALGLFTVKMSGQNSVRVSWHGHGQS